MKECSRQKKVLGTNTGKIALHLHNTLGVVVTRIQTRNRDEKFEQWQHIKGVKIVDIILVSTCDQLNPCSS